MENRLSDNLADWECKLLSDGLGIYGLGYRHRTSLPIQRPSRLPDDVIIRADKIPNVDEDIGFPVAFEPFDTVKRFVYSEARRGQFAESKYFWLELRRLSLLDGMSDLCFDASLRGGRTRIVSSKALERISCYQTSALGTLGQLFDTAFTECISSETLSLIRQLPRQIRWTAYLKLARSSRLTQLMSVFPVLALKVISDPDEVGLNENEAAMTNDMIETGAKLNTIAEKARTPTALRKVSLQEAHKYTALSTRLYPLKDHFRDFWSRNDHQVSDWLNASADALDYGQTFATWVLRKFHLFQGEGDGRREIIRQIGDWVRACQDTDHTGMPRDPFINRLFNSAMHPNTAWELTYYWHNALRQERDFIAGAGLIDDNYVEDYACGEQVAAPLTAEAHFYPSPLVPGASIDGVEIRPITNRGELINAANDLKNCAASYSNSLDARHCSLYVAFENDRQVAMIEVRKRLNRFEVVQCSESNNRTPHPNTLSVVKKWEQTFPRPKEPTWEDIYLTWERELIPADIVYTQDQQQFAQMMGAFDQQHNDLEPEYDAEPTHTEAEEDCSGNWDAERDGGYDYEPEDEYGYETFDGAYRADGSGAWAH